MESFLIDRVHDDLTVCLRARIRELCTGDNPHGISTRSLTDSEISALPALVCALQEQIKSNRDTRWLPLGLCDLLLLEERKCPASVTGCEPTQK